MSNIILVVVMFIQPALVFLYFFIFECSLTSFYQSGPAEALEDDDVDSVETPRF